MVRRMLVIVGMGIWMGQGAATRPLVVPEQATPTAYIEQWMPREEVSDWKEVEVRSRAVGLDEAAREAACWEVRAVEGMKPVAGLDVGLEGGLDLKNGHEEALKALEAQGDGEYLAAWLIRGKRVSNVVRVTVDRNHKITDEPLLRVVATEPAGPGLMPVLAVTTVRRKAEDPALWMPQLVTAQWVVDGQVHRYQGGAAGKGRAPRVGEHEAFEMPRGHYDVKLDLSKVEEVKVVVEGRESAAVAVSGATPLGDAWDAAVSGERAVKSAQEAKGPE
ncbi:MAG TPA: hypothetical protein VHQ47_16790 [Phycisphaerae bacterium]|jgi:hypothetical protein|nr:hypothetical protein [Phycisphaerae bacterium]